MAGDSKDEANPDLGGIGPEWDEATNPASRRYWLRAAGLLHLYRPLLFMASQQASAALNSDELQALTMAMRKAPLRKDGRSLPISDDVLHTFGGWQTWKLLMAPNLDDEPLGTRAPESKSQDEFGTSV